MDKRSLLIGGGALALSGVGAAYAGLRDMGSMAAYNDSVRATRAALKKDPAVVDFIRYASLAASGHNTQPWRFRVGEGRIDILPDLARRTPVVDPDDHHLFVSLGCAAENLAIAAGANGRAGELHFEPANDGSVGFVFGRRSDARSMLFDAIPRRQSTRSIYEGQSVSAGDLQVLAAAATVPGVDLVLITDLPRMDRIRDLVVAGNSEQLTDPAFVRELKTWIRFSPRQAMTRGDGLFAASSGNPALPEWLGPFLFSMVLRADADNDTYAKQIRSSAGLAVFVGEREDKEHWVRTGRACQRFALQATALGMKLAFINQPVEVAHLRPDLAALVGLPERRPDIVMRFGYGAALPFSARRPVDAVLAS